jgi:hypothetical protein
MRLCLFAAAALLLLPTCAAPYKPGLGELMTFQQLRHDKLWLAGSAGNWALAAYEADELQEGFDDVVGYWPTHPDLPLPPAELVPRLVAAPLREVRAAVEAKDAHAFEAAFDKLTAGCNFCHQATNHGFNVVRRPQPGWFGNQDFAPH